MTSSNISEANCKRILEPSRAEETEICSDGPGHLSRIVDMPVDSKKF